MGTEQSAITALQGFNTKFSVLASKAADLAKVDAWSQSKGTSSYDKVSISTTSGAQPTSLDFTVLGTAKAHTISFATSAQLTDSVFTNGNTDITLDMLDGNVYTLPTDGTLQGVVDAINGSGHDLRANTIKLSDGTYRLRVESTKTGADSDFDITKAQGNKPLLGGSTVERAGADAQIQVGADTLSSATNTFTNVLPGVNITLGFDAVANTAVTTTVATDTKAVTDNVKGLVDQLNGLLTDIDTSTQSGAGKTAGILAGDSGMRSLRDQLVSSIYAVAGGTLSSVGIQLDRYAQFTFDEAKFKEAYEADPAKTAAYFRTDAQDRLRGPARGRCEGRQRLRRPAP